MPEEKDSTEISVSKDGFGFKTDGDAASRLAHAALDFLSPITEGTGFLGTKLRGYRMEAALKATLRAKEICEENNLPINPVPPKFLLQWIEGASMEDVEEVESLTEMWANLLVSESTTQLENSQIFIGLVKQLNWRHKSALEKFVEKGSRNVVHNLNGLRLLGQTLFELVAVKRGLSLDRTKLSLDVCEAFQHKNGVLVESITTMKREAYERADLNIDDNLVHKLEEMTSGDQNINIDLHISKNTLLGLKSLNLIEFGAKTSWKIDKSHNMNVFFWFLTEFGFEFINACLATENSQNIKSSFQNDKN